MMNHFGRTASKLLHNPLRKLNPTLLQCVTKNEYTMGRRHISFSKTHLTHYLEDYYTCSEIATNMTSPMGEYIWWGMHFLQAVIVVGCLLHSNYYFTGRFLAKPEGESQMCEDSW